MIVVALFLAAAMAVAWAASGIWLPGLALWLDVGESPSRADYAMVLGGGPHTRPFVAASLVRAGLVPRVLAMPCPEPPDGGASLLVTSPELDWLVLLGEGLRDNQIVPLGSEQAHTYAEAELLAEFLRSRPEARVMVVTNGYHTRRSRWTFRNVLGRHAGQVSFVSAPVDTFILERWWKTEEGVMAVMSEYLKLLFYGVRYGWLAHFALLAVGLGLVLAWIWIARRRARTV